MLRKKKVKKPIIIVKKLKKLKGGLSKPSPIGAGMLKKDRELLKKLGL